MLIIGTFEHSIELEQALAEVENEGIPRKQLLVIPMNNHPNTSNNSISKSNDFYDKGIEVGIACGTAFSVIGTSVGYILKWGPIFGGLASALIGFSIGFGIYYFLNKNTHRHLPKKLPEVTVIVECLEDQSSQIMSIFWKYRVLTVGHVSKAK